MSHASRPKILFFIPEDWYLVSHRLPLLEQAAEMGCEVFVATCVKDHAEPILETGATLIPVRFHRGFRHLSQDLSALRELIRVYRTVRPDIVHQVTLKTVVFGSIAAKIARTPCVVNAIAGLGFAYTSRSLKARLVSPLLSLALRVLVRGRHVRLIIQNADDMRFINEHIGVPMDKIELIRGAGVNTDVFRPAAAEPPPPIRVVLLSRMLRDKGIVEAVEAMRILRDRGRDDIKLILAGRTDLENPAGIHDVELRDWEAEGLVQWMGPVADVPDLLGGCHVALLPSYREGLPKALLECASCGLPIVATDVPGCREICLPDVNGLMVPARASGPIADALERLADDPGLRRRLGAESRRLAVEQYAEGIVSGKTVEVYRKLLEEAGRF